MIQKTKDYSIFKKHESNRDILQSNLKKIISSIRTKNLLMYRPILIDEEMRVIDGQHRLEAAKVLDIEIYYEIQKTATCEDMFLLNDNSKGWSKEDYLHYYVEQGKEEYIKFKDFINKFKITLSTATIVLGQKRGSSKQGDGRDHSTIFKKGEYKFPEKMQADEAVDILKKSEEVIKLIYPKIEGYKSYLSGANFRRALYLFLSIRSVIFDMFLDKLLRRLDLIRPCSAIRDYLKLFKTIYNYNNRNPVHMDEE